MLNSESPLFKLPGELRNRIYSYVLNHDDPLHPAAVFATQYSSKARYEWSTTAFVHQTGWERNAVTQSRAAEVKLVNQLQFVNKQLRDETAGLTYEYNKDQIAIHQNFECQDVLGYQDGTEYLNSPTLQL
jgi:hypothetical protein